MSISTANKYLKVEACGIFDDARMEQRFEVMNDELSSVCAKFAHGMIAMRISAQSFLGPKAESLDRQAIVMQKNDTSCV